MKHFEAGQWADLVRGVAGDRERVEMEAHLASGCRICRRTAEILRDVAAMASAEGRYQLPEYAVHNARAVFVLQRPERVHLFPRIVAHLVYDSFREPLPAGVRARHRLTRHALYEAADYSLDLRLEHQTGKSVVNLVGQIANKKDPGRAPDRLPVFLMSGKEIVARTLSNSFGEFQMEYQPRQHLGLFVQPNPGARSHIEIALTGFSGVDVPTNVSRRSARGTRKSRGKD